MIKVMIYTRDFEKWFEKIEKSVKLDLSRGGCRRNRGEYFLVDKERLFSIEIRKNWNENQRGKIADVVILDREVDWDERIMRASLLGHRGSVIRTENYWAEEERKWGESKMENELKFESEERNKK